MGKKINAKKNPDKDFINFQRTYYGPYIYLSHYIIRFKYYVKDLYEMIYFQDNPMNESSYISIGHHYVKEIKNEKSIPRSYN